MIGAEVFAVGARVAFWSVHVMAMFRNVDLKAKQVLSSIPTTLVGK